MTIVLKIGGSVITDKDGHEDLDRTMLESILDTIAGRDGDIVLVHGAGSFGHPHAKEAGIDTSTATQDTSDATAVHQAVRQLNDRIVKGLQDRGTAAIGLHPSSMLTRDQALDGTIGPVRNALAADMVPVLHGDIILEESGASIVSGDELVPYLARELGATAGICSDLPGIIGPDGSVLERVTATTDLTDHSDSSDASGGILGKVETILAYDIPVRILGPDDCTAFLDGEPVGTLVTRDR